MREREREYRNKREEKEKWKYRKQNCPQMCCNVRFECVWCSISKYTQTKCKEREKKKNEKVENRGPNDCNNNNKKKNLQ